MGKAIQFSPEGLVDRAVDCRKNLLTLCDVSVALLAGAGDKGKAEIADSVG